MKLSTKARYGLRAMVQLATNYGERPMLVAAIAGKEDISTKYLHSLMGTLRARGLVRSIRGTGGGFILTRSPAEITVGEIVTALEGSLSIVDCVKRDDFCTRAAFCVTREVWRMLNDDIEHSLGGITLESLVVKRKERDAPDSASMYYI